MPLRVFVIAFALLTGATVLTDCSAPQTRTSGSDASSVISSAECAQNKAAGTITYVSPFGFDASAGIIDVFAAEKLGYFGDLCLTTKFVTNSDDYLSLVSSGSATTTSTGSAADFLVAAATGANIEAVATYGDTSDYCIITQKSITSLKQLEGKSLGYHFVEEAPDLEMLAAAGVVTSKIHMVDTSDYDPNQIIQGKLDAVGCYQSNEPLTLRAEGAQFNEFTPQQFGVSGTYNVVFFNAGFLKDHYAAARDWMRADLHAFAYCEAYKSSCVGIEERYAEQAGADFSVSHETSVWNLESSLSENHTLPGKGIGVETDGEWRPEAQEVVRFHLVKSLPSLEKYENTQMVASLYKGKTLIWP